MSCSNRRLSLPLPAIRHSSRGLQDSPWLVGLLPRGILAGDESSTFPSSSFFSSPKSEVQLCLVVGSNAPLAATCSSSIAATNDCFSLTKYNLPRLASRSARETSGARRKRMLISIDLHLDGPRVMPELRLDGRQ
mmetsp:Transcript_22649/g.50376  ORF Transcript_22649/g.50376 Transcript_22649/m.50376 type:complete len:135 (-) Transcript_22649:162-566(-)